MQESEPSWDHSGDTSATFHGEKASPATTTTNTPDPLEIDGNGLAGPFPVPPGDQTTTVNGGVSSNGDASPPTESGDQDFPAYSNRDNVHPRDSAALEEFVSEMPTLRRMQDFDSEPELDTEPVEIQVTADVHRSRGNSESQPHCNSDGVLSDQNHNHQGSHSDGEQTDSHTTCNGDITNGNAPQNGLDAATIDNKNHGMSGHSSDVVGKGDPANNNGSASRTVDDSLANSKENNSTNNNASCGKVYKCEPNDLETDSSQLKTVSNPNFAFKPAMPDLELEVISDANVKTEGKR